MDWVYIGVEYLETTCLGPILSGDIQQLLITGTA